MREFFFNEYLKQIQAENKRREEAERKNMRDIRHHARSIHAGSVNKSPDGFGLVEVFGLLDALGLLPDAPEQEGARPTPEPPEQGTLRSDIALLIEQGHKDELAAYVDFLMTKHQLR